MRALAAASARSASTRSGRRSSSSEGRPAGTAGAPGASSKRLAHAHACLRTPAAGVRPSSTASATSSRSRVALERRQLRAHHGGLGLELAQLELRDHPAAAGACAAAPSASSRSGTVLPRRARPARRAQRSAKYDLRDLRREREAHRFARGLARLELGARRGGAGAQAAEEIELVGHVQRRRGGCCTRAGCRETRSRCASRPAGG